MIVVGLVLLLMILGVGVFQVILWSQVKQLKLDIEQRLGTGTPDKVILDDAGPTDW